MTVRKLSLAALCTLVGALVLSCAPALAVTKYVQESSFGSGVLPGNPLGLAVDQAGGEVFVADGGSVQRFAPVNRSAPSAGYSLGSPLTGSFTSAFAVGVDDSGGLSQGDVYVVEAGAVVDKFDATGLPDASTPQFGSGASPLALTEAIGVAVDPADGDVYVIDGANSVVDIFTPAGGFVAQFATGHEPGGLAFNSTGSDVYVAAGGNLDEYDSSGSPVEQTAGPNVGTNVVDGSGEVLTVAVDTSTNDVYADERENVAVYEASGAPLGQLGFNTGIFFSLGIAVDSSTHTVFVGDFLNTVVDVFGLVILPTVSTGQATGVTETSATLNGTVNPEGVPVTSCQFEYNGVSASCSAPPGSGTEPVQVHADVEGLTPNTTYDFHLKVGNANGSETALDETFTTPGRPIVDGESLSEVGSTVATINAQVNAVGSPTTYRFEYGPSSAYGSSTPQVSLGFAQGDVGALAQLSGLAPDTVYHFRVLATNALGTTPGGDITFSTFSLAAYSLPDGRAYEMVTPADNQNANVYVPGSATPRCRLHVATISSFGGR